jgi:hypothetical protein
MRRLPYLVVKATGSACVIGDDHVHGAVLEERHPGEAWPSWIVHSSCC